MYVGFPYTIFSNRGPPEAEFPSGSLPTTRTATREAPHKQNYDQGAGRITPRELVVLLAGWLAGNLGCWLAGSVPERSRQAQRGGPWMEQTCHSLDWRLPTSRITTREHTHKQNYNLAAYPQAELRPGNWLAGWLAGWRNYDQGTCHAFGWLAGWGLAGWLSPREAQSVPERQSMDRTSLSCA